MIGSAWGLRRPAASVLHLDSAAASRQSEATLTVTAAHAHSEATEGAYVAAAGADATIEAGRAALAGLLGMSPDGTALIESASAGLAALLRVWPLPAGARVATAASEWGPNAEVLAGAGLDLTTLPVDGTGAVDVTALTAQLHDDPPDLIHLTQAASHRGLVQPVAAAVRSAREFGVPVWVDAAQAIGHVATDCGADAVYATSRKWLAGPRGVGVVAVAAEHWARLSIRRPAMEPPDLAPMRYLDSHDAHVAGRVGLANAVAELQRDGPAEVYARLAEVGRCAREVLGGVPGWAVDAGTSAIVALTPTDGQDVVAVRGRLLAEHRILTTACLAARAPRDLTSPVLRVSPHVDVTVPDLERLAAAISATP